MNDQSLRGEEFDKLAGTLAEELDALSDGRVLDLTATLNFIIVLYRFVVRLCLVVF